MALVDVQSTNAMFLHIAAEDASGKNNQGKFSVIISVKRANVIDVLARNLHFFVS